MKKPKISIKANKKITALDKYAGEWVAFLDKRVVGNGRTLKSLMRKVEKKKLEKKVTVFCVPKKGVIHIY